MNGYKKHRGLKRYYENLAVKNDLTKATWLNWNHLDMWFDNWHLHFDWKGYGNNSFRRRKPHLDKLFRHFDLMAKEVGRLNKDFQLFVILLDHQSCYDAVYVNTPNPNRDFPFVPIDELCPESTLTNPNLVSYVNGLENYEKLYGVADEAYCLLYRKSVGLSFG